MKEIKLLIPILFISFFSGLNISNGFDFSVTDTSVNDAFSTSLEAEEKIENVEANISELKTPVSTATTRKTVISSSKNVIKIAGNTVSLVPTNCNTMPTPNYSSANYCNFQGSPNLFIYGHNTNNIFGRLKNLSVGSTFTITLNNTTTTYRITDKFSDTVTNLNSNSGLRSSIYKGYYRSTSDVTIQTCYGINDSERLYIKAVRV